MSKNTNKTNSQNLKPKSSQSRGKVSFVVIEEEYAGQRVDNFLLRHLKGVPRSLVYRLLRKGEVRVNKGRIKAEYRLQAGDSLRVPPLRRPEPNELPKPSNQLIERLESNILFENNDLLVLNKPAGLAVHGGSGVNLGLIEALRQTRTSDRFLELVHRIDKETSGCLLVAKKRSALRFLQEALRQHQFSKQYIALVEGHWPNRRKYVEVKLKRYQLASGERRVKVSEEGKESKTNFTVLERYEASLGELTLLEAEPVTGRTHQIRVHAQYLGFPLLCDEKYNSDESNKSAKALGFSRMFLHASQLTFPLPSAEGDKTKRMTIEAPLPNDLSKPLKKLNKVKS